MRFHSLQHWLAWQETLHPAAIDLGLDRVRAVAARLDLLPTPVHVLTVAGTNGKGTVAHLLAALLTQAGYRVGLYTSPHLLRYNERIQVAGVAASDSELCAAFDAVDQARGSISLTYFEFGTLAAAWVFRERAVTAQVLEVGLGGRLDAVNIWDPQIAIITGVALDHQAWLGDDREAIGREKAGILRAGRPAIIGELDPPQSVLDHARGLPVSVLRRAGIDFGLDLTAGEGGRWWSWQGEPQSLGLSDTLLSSLRGARGQNLATALAAATEWGLGPVPSRSWPGILAALPRGRLQHVPGVPEWLLDVAHNPQGGQELARWLAAHPHAGPTVAVVGIMTDKDHKALLRPLLPHVDHWLCLTLPPPRGLPGEQIALVLRELGVGEAPEVKSPEVESPEVVFPEVVRPAVVPPEVPPEIVPPEIVPPEIVPGATIFARARECAGTAGRIVVFGSFLTVQAAFEAEPSLADVTAKPDKAQTLA